MHKVTGNVLQSVEFISSGVKLHCAFDKGGRSLGLEHTPSLFQRKVSSSLHFITISGNIHEALLDKEP